MGILDKLKHAMTGGVAKVALVKHDGELAPGAMVYVKIEVEALAALTSKGVFVDLHGEDDLDENVLDKAAEIFDPDPEYRWPVHEAFTLGAGEKRIFENALALPPDIELGARHWLVRARIEALGKDPTSAWVEFGKATG